MYYYKFTRIFLMLGSACNMQCRHCTQGQYRETDTVPKTDRLTEETLNYILNAASKVKTMEIVFWGGEPLVYLEKIKNIVEQLKVANNISYRIITNGLLFAEETMEYLAENDFKVALSYDAPNPTLYRNVVPSEKALQLFNNYRGKKAVVGAFVAGNTDLVEAERMLNELFPNVPHDFNKPICIHEGAKIVLDYKKGEIRNAIIDYAKKCGKVLWENNFISRKAKYDEETFKWVQMPTCGEGFSTHGIDCDGNIYLCHDSGIVFGHISDDQNELTKKYLMEWFKRRPPKCLKCDVKEYCWGHCGMELLKENGEEYCSCDAMREIIKAILEAKELVENGN